MSAKKTPGLVAADESLAVVNSSDPLTVSVKGLQYLENVLNLAISETLPEPHALDIRRLNFSLKVDLSIALGLIPGEDRSTYMKINRIRNSFAHDAYASLEPDAARELFDTLSARHRHILRKHTYEDFEDSLDILRYALTVLMVSVEVVVTRLRDAKVEAEVTHQMVLEVLNRHKTKPHWSDSNRAREISRRVAEAREKRNMEGEF